MSPFPASCGHQTAQRGPLLPSSVARQVWRGDELRASSDPAVPTGFAELDEHLPGGGWPTRCVTEVLSPQPAASEWRLMAPAVRASGLANRPIVVIGPPRVPCIAGLRHEGIDEHRLIWIRAEQPVERLWAAEHVIRSTGIGALLVWLPHVRPEQIRRLQVAAQSQSGLVFLIRPEQARREASAAPLRLSVAVRSDWSLEVDIFKRSGAPLEQTLRLDSIPGGLRSILTRRLRSPRSSPRSTAIPISPLISRPLHAVGVPAAVEPRAVHLA